MQVLKLSDAYTVREEEPAMELKVLMLNINKGYNKKLMNACKTLKDYAEYTSRIRSYAKDMGIEASVEMAIAECIGEGILKEFLEKNRAEAREEEREEGILIGKSEMIRFTQLIGVLLQEGKIDDIVRVTKDEAIRERYYTEYHIQ